MKSCITGELKIKSAKEADLNSILTLQKLCYQSEAALYNDYNIEPLTQTRQDFINQFQNGIIYLASYLNEKLIASVRGFVKNDTGFIGKLIVHPDFQNRGYGKLMMKAIEKELNTHRFELFTGNKSEKNINLYKKMNYEIYKEETINELITLIFLEKKL